MSKKPLSSLTGCRFEALHPVLKAWLRDRRFATFLESNHDKVRSKFAGAKELEDAHDVLFELEVAVLLLGNAKFTLEYEPSAMSRRGPDFLVQSDAAKFTVEAKRIRPCRAERVYSESVDTIVSHFRSIRSSLGVSIVCHNSRPNLLDKLAASLPELLPRITEQIRLCEQELRADEDREWHALGPDHGLMLRFAKLRGKDRSSPTAHLGGVAPIPYTNLEWRKFSDTIFEKLGQLHPKTGNVIMIGTQNATHEPEDLAQAIDKINEIVRERDETVLRSKGFEGLWDFLDQASRLSGVVFRSSFSPSNWRNLVWTNDGATNALHGDIVAFLGNMDSSGQLLGVARDERRAARSSQSGS